MKEIRIGGEYIKVRSHIVNIFGYSGHKDSDGLIDFIGEMQDNLKKFCCYGRTKIINVFNTKN